MIANCIADTFTVTQQLKSESFLFTPGKQICQRQHLSKRGVLVQSRYPVHARQANMAMEFNQGTAYGEE